MTILWNINSSTISLCFQPFYSLSDPSQVVRGWDYSEYRKRWQEESRENEISPSQIILARERGRVIPCSLLIFSLFLSHPPPRSPCRRARASDGRGSIRLRVHDPHARHGGNRRGRPHRALHRAQRDRLHVGQEADVGHRADAGGYVPISAPCSGVRCLRVCSIASPTRGILVVFNCWSKLN